jgi:predicted RNA-binding Zn-ribbon protein involved in translation (DUF1610 family)
MHVAGEAQIWNVAASMSEFKFACPVCGQHIKCDSSQTGSVMDCPTCFQKIAVPQAPADADQKFIITGTQVGGQRPVKTPELNPYAATQAKGFPGAIVVALILLFIGAVVAFVYHGTIFKSPAHDTNEVASADGSPPPAVHKAAKPPLVAPPANDTNWTLSLDTAAIPAVKAAGRIHGRDFIVERASLSNGTLILREGAHGPVTFGFTVNFSGAQPEALAGKTINVTTNASTAAHVVLHWRNDAESGKDNFNSGYAMRLEFGALTNNRLPGKIYLCTPDEEKSYLLGTFNADARKPKPKTIQP